ncbi:hypothetical protein TNCV_2880221 [Trichonephila clavipes]|uniref:Uncharacterized protein n=1 Tax=Trichonephila clavipes TaxID=2585209 RepID=A0A8X6W242_TRICX|nr:hypothetical protein TNCV_2880221 [Trichonephila clavipes]
MFRDRELIVGIEKDDVGEFDRPIQRGDCRQLDDDKSTQNKRLKPRLVGESCDNSRRQNDQPDEKSDKRIPWCAAPWWD